MSGNIMVLKGKIIDGTGKDPIENGIIIVDDNIISKIGSKKEINIPRNANYLEGNILMPGMIDSHIHLSINGEPDPIKVFINSSLSTYAIKATIYVKRSLEAGFTTLRSLGEPGHLGISIRDAINQGIILGSRIFTSGSTLSMTGGAGTFLPPWISSNINMDIFVDGVGEVRKAVRKLVGTGVDLIKILATGGIISTATEPGAQSYNLDEIEAIVFEAHKFGKKVAAHVEGLSGAKDCIKANVDTLEHGIDLDEEAVEEMRLKGIILVPTLLAPYNICKHGIEAGIQEYVVRKSEKIMKIHCQSFKLAYQAGVKIAMGTDTATPFSQHGHNAKELELYVKNGMKPMEAIISATKTASEAIGISHYIGTLEKGKLADVLIVDGDPLDDITVLQKKEKINTVIKDGKIVYKK